LSAEYAAAARFIHKFTYAEARFVASPPTALKRSRHFFNRDASVSIDLFDKNAVRDKKQPGYDGITTTGV
jgi:hypothetical protein